MAGGFGSKPASKSNQIGKSSIFSNEIVNSQPCQDFSQVKFKGVLGLGQTIEFNKNPNENNKKNWGQEFLSGHNIQKEEKTIFDSHEIEIKQAVEELRQEIQKLIKSTNELSVDVEKVAFEENTDVSEYQVKFLQRIKIFVVNFQQNISEAHVWLDSFNSKSKKKNSFWNKAKNKKSGGEQYLFSSEHSASRSAN